MYYDSRTQEDRSGQDAAQPEVVAPSPPPLPLQLATSGVSCISLPAAALTTQSSTGDGTRVSSSCAARESNDSQDLQELSKQDLAASLRRHTMPALQAAAVQEELRRLQAQEAEEAEGGGEDDSAGYAVHDPLPLLLAGSVRSKQQQWRQHEKAAKQQQQQHQSQEQRPAKTEQQHQQQQRRQLAWDLSGLDKGQPPPVEQEQQKGQHVRPERTQSDEINPAPYDSTRVGSDWQADRLQPHRRDRQLEGLGVSADSSTTWEDDGGICSSRASSSRPQIRESSRVAATGRAYRSLEDSFNGSGGCPTTAEILAIIREGSQISNDLVAGQMGLMSAASKPSAAALASMGPQGAASSRSFAPAATQGGRLAVDPNQVLQMPVMHMTPYAPIRHLQQQRQQRRGSGVAEQQQAKQQQQQQAMSRATGWITSHCSPGAKAEPTSPTGQSRKHKGMLC